MIHEVLPNRVVLVRHTRDKEFRTDAVDAGHEDWGPVPFEACVIERPKCPDIPQHTLRKRGANGFLYVTNKCVPGLDINAGLCVGGGHDALLECGSRSVGKW
jgi:hypothetical protein